MGVVGRSRRWTDAGGWEIRESWYVSTSLQLYVPTSGVPRREACDASMLLRRRRLVGGAAAGGRHVPVGRPAPAPARPSSESDRAVTTSIGSSAEGSDGSRSAESIRPPPGKRGTDGGRPTRDSAAAGAALLQRR